MNSDQPPPPKKIQVDPSAEFLGPPTSKIQVNPFAEFEG